MKLKECEDTHLGEEVDRNWAEVVTQQYVFDRLNREVRMSHANGSNGCTQPSLRSQTTAVYSPLYSI